MSAVMHICFASCGDCARKAGPVQNYQRLSLQRGKSGLTAEVVDLEDGGTTFRRCAL